jgi:hypothetical protein
MQTDDIFVYLVDLPDGIHEMVTPCCDGYTVYIDLKLNDKQRRKEYLHALDHIRRNDFEKENVQIIESEVRKVF